jgi:ubiquinol-cytochrome c reductase iron-sulfur subunit
VVNRLTMSLSAASSTLLRTCARQQLPTARAAVTSCQQTRGVADAKASFESPFATANERGSTLKIPNFSKYQSNKSPRSNQVFSYFMAGTMGLATAVGAKATVQGTLSIRIQFIFRDDPRVICGEMGLIPTIMARDIDYRD